METIKQILENFIAGLYTRLEEQNTSWAKGYFQGQIDAYKIVLMQIDTEIFIKDLQEKTENYKNKGGKNDL